jgi:hypothetical protein
MPNLEPESSFRHGEASRGGFGILLRQASDASQPCRELALYRPAIRKRADGKKRKPNCCGYLSYLVLQRVLLGAGRDARRVEM